MWNINGLPGDSLSIENGIIMFSSRRWPLMIDPQTQANKFIKNLGKSNNDCLNVLKQTDRNLIKNLEISIPMGKWVLIENIGETIEPSLEPILLKNLVK
jgi:dynein heavy chain